MGENGSFPNNVEIQWLGAGRCVGLMTCTPIRVTWQMQQQQDYGCVIAWSTQCCIQQSMYAFALVYDPSRHGAVAYTPWAVTHISVCTCANVPMPMQQPTTGAPASPGAVSRSVPDGVVVFRRGKLPLRPGMELEEFTQVRVCVSVCIRACVCECMCAAWTWAAIL